MTAPRACLRHPQHALNDSCDSHLSASRELNPLYNDVASVGGCVPRGWRLPYKKRFQRKHNATVLRVCLGTERAQRVRRVRGEGLDNYRKNTSRTRFKATPRSALRAALRAPVRRPKRSLAAAVSRAPKQAPQRGSERSARSPLAPRSAHAKIPFTYLRIFPPRPIPYRPKPTHLSFLAASGPKRCLAVLEPRLHHRAARPTRV